MFIIKEIWDYKSSKLEEIYVDMTTYQIKVVRLV